MYGDLTEAIDTARAGPATGAFFDLDRTLLEGFSVYSFLQQRLTSGAMPPREMLANAAAVTNYTLGRVGFSGVLRTTSRALRGVSERSFVDLGQEVFQKHLRSRVYPEARALVDAHQRKGHTVAIISSATRYQIEPVARELGIQHVLCTRLEVEDGVFTGEIVPPPCWKEGKATAARNLAREQGLELEASYFYTDAAEDLPLLEIVGNPHPLNPDKELAAIAAERGWPVHRFAKRKTGVAETLRTGLAYGGMVPAMLAGLPTKWLTGSARQAANVTMSSWADFATAAIGLDIRIVGQEYLWSNRPAVFVFNHQSAADAMIVGRLLRQDFCGIAKIEASRNPFTGPFLKAAGTVFIDRGNRTQALNALKPAVDALCNGTSIALAPEGTRSESARLGAFKKGAFHMAMQAGVPMVPIVIHNAMDCQPKGETVFRPATIYVEVLPPVATDGWRPETVDRHIAEVRAMFLRALGQDTDRRKSPAETKLRNRPRQRTALRKGTAGEASKRSAAGKQNPKRRTRT
jgi:putative phosphoserine phosphatase/1-acylglycerol-3-phosphate O-acyltransferase